MERKSNNIKIFLTSLLWIILSSYVPFLVFLSILFFCHFKKAKFYLTNAFKNFIHKSEEQGQSLAGVNQDDSNHDPELLDFLRNNWVNSTSVGWINKILSKLWKICLSPNVNVGNFRKHLDHFCKDLETDESKFASLFRRITIEETNIGDCPLQITDITTDNSEKYLAFNVGVVYPGNGFFAVGMKHPELHASLRNFGLAFKLNVILGPFTRDFTLMKEVSVSLLERPIITLEGEGVVHIPIEIGMMAISKILFPLLGWCMIEPKCLRIQFQRLRYHYPVMSKALGVLEVQVVEGKDLSLSEQDYLFTNKTSCILKIGRNWAETNKVKTTNPVWNFVAKFPILDSPLDKELVVEVLNKSILMEENLIGLSSINLKDVVKSGESVTDSWLNVSSISGQGFVRVRTHFIPCENQYSPITEQSNRAILVIFLKSVQTNRHIEPIIGIQLPGQIFTTVKGNYSTNHEFLEEIVVVLDNINEDLIRICLYDAAAPKTPTVRISKCLLKVRRALYNESLAHKKKNNDNLGVLIGSKTFKAKSLLEEKNKPVNLNPTKIIDSTISLECSIFPLITPCQESLPNIN